MTPPGRRGTLGEARAGEQAERAIKVKPVIAQNPFTVICPPGTARPAP